MARKFLIFLIGLLAALMVTSFFLPDRLLVERSASIAKPPFFVYSLLNDLNNYQYWSPWHEQSYEYLHSGPEQGVGSSLSWINLNREESRIEIIESNTAKSISLQIEFNNKGSILNHFQFYPLATGTQLIWKYEADLSSVENPLYRYAGRYLLLLMRGWVESDYDRGLDKIRKLAEEGAG